MSSRRGKSLAGHALPVRSTSAALGREPASPSAHPAESPYPTPGAKECADPALFATSVWTSLTQRQTSEQMLQSRVDKDILEYLTDT